MVDAHALAEARSLAAHRVIADRLQTDGGVVLAAARQRVETWQRERPGPYVTRWAEWLGGSAADVAARIVADDEDGRAMRQCTPFAGALTPRERWALWRDVRARMSAPC